MQIPSVLEKQKSIQDQIRTGYLGNAGAWKWRSKNSERFQNEIPLIDFSTSDSFKSTLLKATGYYVRSASQLRVI